MSRMFTLMLTFSLASFAAADLRMASWPKSGYDLRDQGYTPWNTKQGSPLMHSRYMEPSTFGYQGLENQKARNYDNFLRSNIDNEQDNRNFDNEDGEDHLPFRTLATEVSPLYLRPPQGRRRGNGVAQVAKEVIQYTEPGETTYVPLRWNNPHSAEMEINIWIFQTGSTQPVVVPIRKPSCSGEGYQDNIVSFTVPSDFSKLGEKIPGFKGCNVDTKPMCSLQLYSHSVESRQYAIGFPIVVAGHDASLTTETSEQIQKASEDPWLEIDNLRDICLPATDPSATIATSVPRWARLASDVYTHSYMNSDYSPYSGQQQESISKNLQASAINKMEVGNRGELGKSILTQEAKNRLNRLRGLEDRIYKNYEALANRIINRLGHIMPTALEVDELGLQSLSRCFRCAEVGSTNQERLQTNTYIPSYQLPESLQTEARSLVPSQYQGLITQSGLVQIYVASMNDLLPFFYESRHLGIMYQPAELKTTLSTKADSTNFKKRDENDDTDGGVYAATQAKKAWAESHGCSAECLDSQPACRAVLYQHDLGGWAAIFPPGDYNAQQMIEQGAQNNDASSIKVLGENCSAEVYQNNDFTGWKALYAAGEYRFRQFLAAGARNDDASSIRVFQTPMEQRIQQAFAKAEPTAVYQHLQKETFDGTKCIDDGKSANLPTGPYTIEAEVKPNEDVRNGGIVGWGDYGSRNRVNALRFDGGASRLHHYWWGNDLNARPSSSLADGSFHHVAVTYDGSIRRMYVDYKPIGAIIGGGYSATNKDTFCIGKTYGAEYFKGEIQNVKIWNYSKDPDAPAINTAGPKEEYAKPLIKGTVGTKISGTCVPCAQFFGNGTKPLSRAVAANGVLPKVGEPTISSLAADIAASGLPGDMQQLEPNPEEGNVFQPGNSPELKPAF